jgi:hypothetical protein
MKGQDGISILFLPAWGEGHLTVISDVKTTLANLEAIHASFSKLALSAADFESKKIFHECMMETEPIIKDMRLHVEFLKAEEQQYRKS